ncbi:unnamed protein product, partial [Polarella glacialis]
LLPMTSTVVYLEAHGKAVVVKGDTQPIKDFLKTCGGKWNKGLTGWIFPGSKKAKLLSDLQGHSNVKNVVDRAKSLDSSQPAPSGAAAKRSVEGSSAEEPAAKKPKPVVAQASSSQQSSEEQVFDLPEDARATVSAFQGKMGLDLRKFYTDKASGELRPTPKGVRIQVHEWEALCSVMAEIDAKVKSEASNEVEVTVKVTDDILASIRFQKSAARSIDVRRMYVDKSDGQQKPTKKGISFSMAQWAGLKALLQDIAAALGGTKVSSSSSSTASPSQREKKSKQPSTFSPQASVPDSVADGARLRAALVKILEGRDLQTLSLKAVRSELEAALSLPEGSLASRKEEVKGIVTDIIQSGETAGD